ncbi:biotinidase isoform X2 [Parasteatoda tepidariorum]|uniref:biotinidase isoform X2 n=1 Tax=Parasteatoda tepidariorum TaxID=114398 RepID=UPI00077FD19C|nr:pantetheinase isoform X1 [Parasteatoda tepidariorum]
MKLCDLRDYKGAIFILGICASVIILTYLTMNLLPKLRQTKDQNYYRAAVLEAIPYSDPSISIKAVVEKNLETYQLAANIAGGNEVDIIVFPEDILFFDSDDYTEHRSALIGSIASDIPDPTYGNYNPCDQKDVFKNHFLLRNLSCMAKSNNLYIVANLVDYKMCKNGGGKDRNATLNCSDKSECPSDGIYLYNTNVVFNRAGKLIARYYKKHLYFEPSMNPSKCPYNGFFDTDFGNFTTIVCFDMLFKEALEDIEQLNVNNLAYPYFWYDHTPIHQFATVVQQYYAYSNRINVLAANGHVPGTGSLGSGIYSGHSGALISTHQPDGHSRLLISDVPKQPKSLKVNAGDLNRKRFKMVNGTFVVDNVEDDIVLEDQCEIDVVGPPKDESKDYRCNSMNLTDYKFQRLNKTEGKIDLCVNTFCCSVTYKARSMNEEYFIAVQASDFDAYKIVHYSNQICFLARCKSENGKDCSSFYMKSETVFEEVKLMGTFFNKYMYPFSIDANIRLTSKDKWSYDGNVQMNYQNKDNSSLLFFGIYGRDYPDS